MGELSEQEVRPASQRPARQSFITYLVWAALSLVLLWTANAAAQLLTSWVGFLRSSRASLGIPVPVRGPDFLIIGGVGALAICCVVVGLLCYSSYRRAWNRKLIAVWGHLPAAGLTKALPLSYSASQSSLQRHSAYLDQLAAAPGWASAGLKRNGDTRLDYEDLAARFLREIETDVAARAVSVGLVVGLNRNRLLDTLSIIASNLELQLHVLTRLGKRPSLATWMELLKRAGTGVFLNTYVSREDCLYLNLAIKKAALGAEIASESMDQAAGLLSDLDWDEVLGHVNVPGLSAVTSLATVGMSVGAFGLRQIGAFIEAASNDLLQGVLAGGVLYFHGMSLAAECLSLDQQHRASVLMNRTISQSMMVSCAPAGRMLRDQVRRMRAFFRERRQLAVTAAKDVAKQGVDKLREASASGWESVKGAGKIFRRD